MTKRVVYVEPGDMIEVRICYMDEGANASAWKASTRPASMLLTVEGSDRLLVPELGVNVFLGISRRQLLLRKDS